MTDPAAMPSGTSTSDRPRRAAFFSLALGCAGVVAALTIGEVAVRTLSHRELDGNRWLGWRRLKPFRLPLQILEGAARRAQDPRSHFSYDADLGWIPKPGLRTVDCAHDARGLRIWNREASPAVDERAWHIGLFGDSFVYGADVPPEESMAAFLDGLLSAPGAPVVVSNYGVPGYGVDQAFLRWRKDGRGERNVILGLPRVDVPRNLNVVKALYIGFLSRLGPENTLPFSKPRFRLDRGALGLVNHPALSPEAVVADLRNPGRSRLLRYEGFYEPRDYQAGGLRRSLLWCAVADIGARNRFTLARGTVFWANDDQRLFAPGSESRDLLLVILDTFAREVASDGGQFHVLYLPERDELTQSMTGVPPDPHYAGLWQLLRTRYRVVDPGQELLAAARSGTIDAVFMPGGHYSRAGNEIVAKAIAAALSPRPASAP